MRLLPALLALLALTASAQIPLREGDGVMFHGAGLVERLLEHGELPALLHLAHPHLHLRVRSVAWTGDEVGHRLRPEGYAAHVKELIAAWPARVVVAGYGGNESFAGAAGLEAFRRDARAHLDQLSRLHPDSTLVVLSPTPVEAGSRPGQPDPAARNAEIAAYALVLEELARERKARFVDLRKALFNAHAPFTQDGTLLNPAGLRVAARAIAAELVGTQAVGDIDQLRLAELIPAAAQQAHFVAEVVRPKNGVLYYGVRKRPEERAAEIPLYLKRIEKADEVLHALAADPYKRFADLPAVTLPPLPKSDKMGTKGGVGAVRPAAQAMAEFKVADGYAVNLFASDEQFPDLRSPVQIAFDARGRLWVVTMPSFPHTVPGQPQEDKVLVLEDKDRDGKADTCTVFAEGFDALDGIAFHERGVIVSEQSRHWLLNDTDGDGRADRKEELLRGLDVTDSHHGGMIATDPMGAVWFCDGVFHRSQFETPFGVHRARDSTTFRHNLLTGRIETEWQSDTPNPWKITFDRHGMPFQMYGGGHLLDGTVLAWTPLGLYHEYGHGKVLNYGKGSGAASVSSPNFPAAYQQGSVSASLLGTFAVSLTRHNSSAGPAEGVDRLDLLSSPNPAFRPVDLAFGMDGGLYVSDFSSAIIGHAQNPMRDPRWNHVRGRVWRVIHSAGPVERNWPLIEGAGDDALFALLAHPQDLVRQHARLEYRRRAARGLEERMARLAPTAPDAEQVRLEAAWILEGLGQVRPAWLDALARARDPGVRAACARLIRVQADRLPDEAARLAALANDPEPRVQLAVVGAVAALRARDSTIESALARLEPRSPAVTRMRDELSQGAQSRVGPSVPVLEVSPDTRVDGWEQIAPGQFRVHARARAATAALLAIKHGYVDVSLNGVQRLSTDNRWSSDQQVALELQPGLNRIDLTLRKYNNKSGKPPAVSLFDPLGRKLEGVKLAGKPGEAMAWAQEYDRAAGANGRLVRIQSAPGLQFAPRELRVKAGERVRLVFENPDDMEHNLLIAAPGSREALGALADALALRPEARDRAYIPDSKQVLHHTPIVPPKGRAELLFDAPAKPGTYPILCTFPGHWVVMRAELVVEK